MTPCASASPLRTGDESGDPTHAGRDSQPRQLRLVEDAELWPGVPAGPPLDPTPEPTSSNDPEPSLAAYLLGLAAGSACFCCGAPLAVVEVPSPGGDGDEDAGRLECRSCGAFVEGPGGS